MRRNIRIQARNVRKTNRVCLVIEIHGIAKEMMLFLRLHSAFDVSYHLLSQRTMRWELTRILLEDVSKQEKLISMHRWSSETLYCYRRLFLPSRLESSRIMCEKTSQIRGSVHSGLVVKPSLWSSFCTCQPNPPKLSSLSQ